MPELQLRRRGEEGTALAIVQRGLERLARAAVPGPRPGAGRQPAGGAPGGGADPALDPGRGAAFAPREEPVYLVPDLVVLQGEHGWRSICRRAACLVSASAASTAICTGTIRTRRSASIWTGRSGRPQWAIQAVEQRRATLLRCAQVLVRRQEAFFQSPGGSLTSLRLADVAAELSIHESTVSRAVREKYLQCARGVYPLSFFFPREVGAGEGQSAMRSKINCSS